MLFSYHLIFNKIKGDLFMGKKERFYADIMAMHPEVTGSCNLVIVKFPNGETRRIVVDCGLFQEKAYEEFNETLPFKPDAVDFCLVTHNHIDHTGRLPFMVKQGYYNKIYATADTCSLMPLALDDSLKVLQTNAKRKNKKCIYKDVDVSNTMRLLVPCAFNEPVQVNEYAKVTFFKNGHLQGAAIILLQLSYPGLQDINLLFTGDYNKKNRFFDVPPLPDWVLDLPITIVQESTYGTTESSEVKQCYKENILSCLAQGGTVISPVFSLQRSQELLYELKCMQKNGELSTDIPIYLDGRLALRYTELYANGELDIKPEMRDFLPENLTFVSDSLREQVLRGKKKKIVLTTSGMGSHGPAQVYIPEYVTRKKAMIHFTGYTAEGTLGRKLQKGELGEIIEVGGMLAKKQARVEYTTEYSSHAKADEMIDFLNQFNDLRMVLVNHGNIGVKEAFAEKILHETEAKKVGLLGRDYFFRVNHYGLVKTLASNF